RIVVGDFLVEVVVRVGVGGRRLRRARGDIGPMALADRELLVGARESLVFSAQLGELVLETFVLTLAGVCAWRAGLRLRIERGVLAGRYLSGCHSCLNFLLVSELGRPVEVGTL